MVTIMRPLITLEVEQSEELYKLEVAGIKQNVQFCVGDILDKWMVTNRKNIGTVIIKIREVSPIDTTNAEPEHFFVRDICNISRERFFGIVVYTISW